MEDVVEQIEEDLTDGEFDGYIDEDESGSKDKEDMNGDGNSNAGDDGDEDVSGGKESISRICVTSWLCSGHVQQISMQFFQLLVTSTWTAMNCLLAHWPSNGTILPTQWLNCCSCVSLTIRVWRIQAGGASYHI